MIQIHADGVLVYDSRLEEYDLQGLQVTGGVNKGGTATIIMPPDHPAYNSFISYKTLVQISRDNVLIFRGRALYPADDFNRIRTVVCEGELCFFQDAVSRPYLYQDTPAAVFTSVIEDYNSQVDSFKRFKVGEITVTDPNDYIRLESESATLVSETINKLLERCGGYIVFTSDIRDGSRVINWYTSLGYRSSQTIEFGENLLDYASTGANTDLITAVLPYGAKNSETGERLTIAAVNGGVDYIKDDEAVAVRGFIIRPVTWDDVTQPTNLLRKAQEYLTANRYIINSLQLTALDMSYLDKSIDSFQVGDTIRVVSKPHHVDEDFLLMDRTEDLLNPANSTVTLGKDVRTLTGADVAGDQQSRDELHKVTHQIRSDYQIGVENAVRESERLYSSVIEQLPEAIRLEVSGTYVTNGDVEEKIETRMSAQQGRFDFEFNTLKGLVEENDADAREQFEEIHKYISFVDGDIILGASDSAVTLTLENDMIVFKKNGATFGWWDGVDFHTGNIVVEVNERAQFGAFAFVPRDDGSLSFLKVGG